MSQDPSLGWVREQTAPSTSSRRYGLIALGVAVVFALLLGAIVLVIGLIRDSHTIPLGRGNATISWISTGGGTSVSQPFTGRAAGLGVTGTAKQPGAESYFPTGASGSSGSFPAKMPIFRVTGTIDGRKFTLDPYFTFQKELNGSPTGPLEPLTCTPTSTAKSVGSQCALPAPIQIHSGSVPNPSVLGRITGRYGSLQINATLTAVPQNGSLGFGFKGTIGTDHIAGAVKSVTRHGRVEAANATFTVAQ